MKRYFTSLMIAVVMATIVVIAWAPPAKSQVNGDGGCLDFCKEQAICACAKILGGSLRLTQCNNDSTCEDTCSSFDCGTQCICTPDPACKLWEKDVVSQSFPPEPPFAQNCFPNG